MIKRFIDRFNANSGHLRAKFAAKHPQNYGEIVRLVLEAVADVEAYGDPDPEKVHEIDDGDYQGTLLFLAPERTYQPSGYYYVFVNYGSCSGCDTLQAIHDYGFDETPREDQVNDYMTLALHVVQGIKKISQHEPGDDS